MSEELASLDALVAAGRYDDAAERAVVAGDFARAVELFARAWNDKRAAEVALLGDLSELAYKHALASSDAALIIAARERVCRDRALAQRLAHAALDRGRAGEAAHLFLASDAPELAASAFEREGDMHAAGDAWMRASKWMEAGRAFEACVRQSPEDASARMKLVAMLVRFSRFEAAAATLQDALAHTPDDTLTLAWLVGVLAALGYDDAAHDRLAALASLDASTPRDLGEFLQERFGSPRGLRKSADGESEALIAGRYRVQRTLGAGGTGRVLLVRDVLNNRDLALKVLHTSQTERGRDAVARFLREARLAMALEHPHLVRVFEVEPSVPFLTMEWMQGGTLADRVASRGALGAQESVHIALGLLEALEALHRRGVVHRDLKPANVFFDAAGHVKLGDLGTAHLVERGATLTGAMMGTLATMAPEQLVGDAAPDARTDLYALGAVLTFMLTGQYPHAGPDFVAQHLNDVPRLPSVLRPALGESFNAFIATLLSKSPQDRPASAAEARALLQSLSFEEPNDAPQPASRTVESSLSAVSSRYRHVADLDATTTRQFDTLLHREVLCVRCPDGASFDALVRFGRIAHVAMQNVLDADAATLRVWIEAPRGVAVQGGLGATAVSELRSVLHALHAAQVFYGPIRRDCLRLHDGHAWLMLPRGAALGTSAAADIAGLEAIL